MTNWNYAETWEVVARTRPDALAMVHGGRRLTWGQFDAHADAVAEALLEAGLGHQSKVAQYLYNCPEYMESFYGALKAGMAPVNTNYRYTADELAYLWRNADVEAVVLDESFLDRAAQVRAELPGIRLWLVVGAHGAVELPSWARRYEEVVAAGRTRGVRGPWGRSGDDLFLVYTGGTTGLPKGVMWRQDDMWSLLNRSAVMRYPEDGGYEHVAAVLAGPSRRRPPRLLSGPPLMHGTGLFTTLAALSSGGALVLLEGRRFDAAELLDTIDREQVTELVIVGDAFARPILDALDAEPGRWSLASLWLIVSSGVMWSAEVRAGLLRHHPGLMLVDTLGSSEAVGLASSLSSSADAPTTGGFRLGAHARVIREDGSDVVPGSGEMGLLAVRGRGPLGYYKDDAKTAATFRVIDGERWSVPGDYATVDLDGTLRLLGRGSVCINTGGEKVFPEEVEEVLKRHRAVDDAVVVGVPDARFNEVVVGLVEWRPGETPPGEASLREWAAERLAGYKCPRHILDVATIGRAPNGKVDYKGLRASAMDRLGIPAPAT